MRDALLQELVHDEGERWHIALCISLDDRDGRVLQYPGIGKRAKETVARFIQRRGRRYLRKADDLSWALISLSAGDEGSQRNDCRKFSNNRAGNSRAPLVAGTTLPKSGGKSIVPSRTN
jgi:hypothetical protein